MRRIKYIIIETLRWIYWFPFRIMVQSLPLRVGYLIVHPAALFGFLFMKKKRRLTEEGFDIMSEGTISGWRRMKSVFKTFENHFKRGIEVIWYPKLTPALAKKIFSFEGLENLDDALAEGRGVVLLHGHLGNSHMLMPAIGFKGYNLSQLGSRNPPLKVDGPLASLLNYMRQRTYEIKLGCKEALPVNFIYTDKTLKDALRRLKDNEVIAIAIDGREGAKWFEVDFLRRKALFSTGAMNLILKMKPVVLPTFVVRQDDNTHKITISKPMDLSITGDKEKDITDNTRTYLAMFEKYIEAYPYLYGDAFWLGDRFFKRAVD